MTNNQTQKLKNQLSRPKNIVVIPHKNPDGDAMGSTLALQQFLSNQGHNSIVIAPNSYPHFLKWLPGNEDVIIYENNQESADKKIEEADFIFTLDFNTLERSGSMTHILQNTQSTFVMIDHHQQPGDYADFMYSVATASSTCELVYDFFDKLEQIDQITPEIATCLYTGIMTDTGSFRFSSTSGHTHRVIANLIEKGANNAVIHQNIFDTNSLNQLNLLGVALKNLKVIEKKHTAYITLTQKELDDHKFKKGDTEGFVNYGLSVKGVIFAAIFIENKDEGIIKISLRSKGDFDVNKVARTHFDGGGHINAAGGKSDKSMTATTRYFEDSLNDYKEELTQL